jgi:hypothetical protein
MAVIDFYLVEAAGSIHLTFPRIIKKALETVKCPRTSTGKTAALVILLYSY